MADHFRPPNSAEIAARQRKIRMEQARERCRWRAKRERGGPARPPPRARVDEDDGHGQA
jgi:hypothetical protein